LALLRSALAFREICKRWYVFIGMSVCSFLGQRLSGNAASFSSYHRPYKAVGVLACQWAAGIVTCRLAFQSNTFQCFTAVNFWKFLSIL
jgi:hypothetical protein